MIGAPRQSLSSRVLFLDFDGVLNSSDFFQRREIANKENHRRSAYGGEIDPVAVTLLDQIAGKDAGVDVVVSSTWRIIHSRTMLGEILARLGFTGRVIGITPRLHESYARGKEIAMWLHERARLAVAGSASDIEHYAILDDDFDAGIGHDQHFVRTDTTWGLKPAHVEQCLKLLGRSIP